MCLISDAHITYYKLPGGTNLQWRGCRHTAVPFQLPQLKSGTVYQSPLSHCHHSVVIWKLSFLTVIPTPDFWLCLPSLLTSHTHRPYHSFQILQPHCTCRSVQSGQAWPLCQDIETANQADCATSGSRWLNPLNTGLASTYLQAQIGQAWSMLIGMTYDDDNNENATKFLNGWVYSDVGPGLWGPFPDFLSSLTTHPPMVKCLPIIILVVPCCGPLWAHKWVKMVKPVHSASERNNKPIATTTTKIATKGRNVDEYETKYWEQ